MNKKPHTRNIFIKNAVRISMFIVLKNYKKLQMFVKSTIYFVKNIIKWSKINK